MTSSSPLAASPSRDFWERMFPPSPPPEDHLVDKLVAGVLHEVNSPLGALASSASTLRGLAAQLEDHAGLPPELRASVELIGRLAGLQTETAARLSSTVRGLERFVDLDRATVRPVDLRRSIDAVVAVLGLGAEVELKLAPDLPEVVTEPRRLHRVLLHLVEQALESKGAQGRVVVCARWQDAATVRVEVSDGGPVRPPEDLQGLFDPRLRGVSGRVRLDLDWASTLREARALGAELRAESSDGRGTTVILEWPLGGRS